MSKPMEFSKFLGKYGSLTAGIVALAAGISVSEATQMLKHFEHFNILHGFGAAFMVLFLFMFWQLNSLPKIVDRLEKHSGKLSELEVLYTGILSGNERSREDHEAIKRRIDSNVREFEKGISELTASIKDIGRSLSQVHVELSRLEGTVDVMSRDRDRK